MRHVSKVVLLGTLISITLGMTGQWARAAELDVGDRAPDFALPATTGEKISLGQFRGKKVVLLEFYGADFAPV